MKRLLAPLTALLALAGCSGPALLDAVNNLTPGDKRVVRRVSGAHYGSDPRQRLDLWRAGDADDRLQPVLVFFYGGSWASGNRRDYGFAARAYAARGFTVVVPDYRLVPGIHFPAFVEDGASTIRWVQDNAARFGGDPKRILLAGHSAGAHIAMLLALDRHYLADAGVDPHRIRAAAGLAGPYDFLPFDVPASINAFGQAPDPQVTQPVHFARADAPPLWLATGSADTTVRPKNSRALAAALQQAGARGSVYREYPGLDHSGIIMALSKTFRGKAPVLAESSAFLMAHAR